MKFTIYLVTHSFLVCCLSCILGKRSLSAASLASSSATYAFARRYASGVHLWEYNTSRRSDFNWFSWIQDSVQYVMQAWLQKVIPLNTYFVHTKLKLDQTTGGGWCQISLIQADGVKQGCEIIEFPVSGTLQNSVRNPIFLQGFPTRYPEKIKVSILRFDSESLKEFWKPNF